MKSGDLDRWLTIERFTSTQDPGSGENIEAWSTLATVRTKYEPVSDGEKVQAGEVGSTLMARFTVRHAPAWEDINPKDRLVFDGRTFDVIGAKEATKEGRLRAIEITAASRSD